MRAPIPQDESDRLAVLESLAIMHTESEQSFDDVVAIARRLFGVPLALVALVGEDCQFFKAKVGIEFSSTHRDLSFCAHAILAERPLVIEDASLDPRFSDNELVSGPFHVRFYAGVPVKVLDQRLGTVCIADTAPRRFTPEDIELLETLGRQVSRLLHDRLEVKRVCQLNDQLTEAQTKLVERNKDLAIAEVRLSAVVSDFELASKRFESLFHELSIASFTYDANGIVQEWNAAATETFGISGADACGEPLYAIFTNGRETKRGSAVMEAIFSQHTIRNSEWRFRRPDGRTIRISSSSFPLHGRNGAIIGAISTHFDITAQKQAEAILRNNESRLRTEQTKLESANRKLHKMATVDALTGIKNHRAFQEVFDAALVSAMRKNRALSLAILDVDRFKSYNDDYGHQHGDYVLARVAELLAESLRTSDTLARYGGEEFAIVMPETTAEAARITCDRLRQVIESAEWKSRPVTVSIGITTLDGHTKSKHDLIEEADRAMYASKRAGRNRCTHIDSVGEAA